MENMLATIFESFPYAIQVYDPDGTLVMVNDVSLKMMHIPHREMVIGSFNILSDPILDHWGPGVRETVAKSFQGETVQFQDQMMPMRAILDRYDKGTLCSDSGYLNIICFPVYDDNDRLRNVVHVLITSKLFNGKQEVVQAKNYLEDHWKDDFDLDEVARSVHLSRSHFSRLFKKETGMTPLQYHHAVKIAKIKDKLLDVNFSIREAFAACGVDYSGNYARLFKCMVGMTPSRYRKANIQNLV